MSSHNPNSDEYLDWVHDILTLLNEVKLLLNNKKDLQVQSIKSYDSNTGPNVLVKIKYNCYSVFNVDPGCLLIEDFLLDNTSYLNGKSGFKGEPTKIANAINNLTKRFRN